MQLRINTALVDLIIRGTTQAASKDLKKRGLTLQQLDSARYARALQNEIKAFTVQTAARRETLRQMGSATQRSWLHVGCTAAASRALDTALAPKPVAVRRHAGCASYVQPRNELSFNQRVNCVYM